VGGHHQSTSRATLEKGEGERKNGRKREKEGKLRVRLGEGGENADNRTAERTSLHFYWALRVGETKSCLPHRS